MAKRSWPFGVTSWDDTVKFAQLLFGVDVAFENYAERLPHRSNKSFLLFAKGACAEGTPFFEIGDFIAPQLEEIQRWEDSTKFVRDMISVGLLPLTGDEEALHRTAACKPRVALQ